MSSFESNIIIDGISFDLKNAFFLKRQFSDAEIVAIRSNLYNNDPFPHLILDNLFDENLLSAVEKEFPLKLKIGRTHAEGDEFYHRSLPFPKLGLATSLYFNLVNSGVMLELLSKITGIDGLIADASLEYGGLHLASAGGKFGIHRDFSHSRSLWLKNRLVMITYLNRNWKTEYDGNLELWDFKNRKMVKSITPEFGRTVIMIHGKKSFHGHPRPLRPPEGESRKSLANYYYTSDGEKLIEKFGHGSVKLHSVHKEQQLESPFFLNYASTKWRGKLILGARLMVPPIAWPLIDFVQKTLLKRNLRRMKSKVD